MHFFNVKRLYLQMLHREICQKPPSFRVDHFLKYIPTLHLCVLPFTGPPWFRLLQYHQVLRCLPSLPPFSQLMDRPGCRTLEQSEVAEPAHLAGRKISVRSSQGQRRHSLHFYSCPLAMGQNTANLELKQVVKKKKKKKV